mmetsp:Transcript_28031/g.43335  ORF Transcript_28031/g.43335 Transcript_28031/m.43335 type:complete len:198 (-) Transcript_28031:2766-3359(-)
MINLSPLLSSLVTSIILANPPVVASDVLDFTNATDVCLENGALDPDTFNTWPLQSQASYCAGVATKELIACYIETAYVVGGWPDFDDKKEANHKREVCDENYRMEMEKADGRAAQMGLNDTRGGIYDLWDYGGSGTDDKVNYVIDKVKELLKEEPRPDPDAPSISSDSSTSVGVAVTPLVGFVIPIISFSVFLLVPF